MAELLVIALLVLANGVFAMAEMAVVSANRLRLERLADAGDDGARRAAALVAAPNELLATVQVGITLIAVLSGAFGGAALAEPLSRALARWQWLAPHAFTVAMALVVLGITYASLVVGELVPKRLALAAPERVASRLARTMTVVSRAAAPLVAVLGASTDLVLRLLRVREREEDPVDEGDIAMLVEQGLKQGTVEPAEREIIVNAFWLGERRVAAILTPRQSLAWLDVERGLDGLREALVNAPHSRYPVCRGGVDEVIGYVRASDLLAELLAGRTPMLEDHLRQPLFVPETLPTLTLLERFKATGVNIAIVLDEYGGVEGMATLKDIVEELVGEVPGGGEDEVPEVVELGPAHWSVAGSLGLEDLARLLGLDPTTLGAPEHEQGEARHGVTVRTVGGLIALLTGQVPRVGDGVTLGRWRLAVTATDRLRVARVAITQEGASRHEKRRLAWRG